MDCAEPNLRCNNKLWLFTQGICMAGTFVFGVNLYFLVSYTSMVTIAIAGTTAPFLFAFIVVRMLSKVPEPVKATSTTSLGCTVDLACPICFINLADEVCVPCGHVFCKGCLEDLETPCAICRAEICMVQKMYV